MDSITCIKCGLPPAFPQLVKAPWTCISCKPSEQPSDPANVEASPIALQGLVVQKPPLGPMPEYLWREKRMWHLIERLAGYANQTDHPYNQEWLVELKTRIEDVLRHNVRVSESAGEQPKP